MEVFHGTPARFEAFDDEYVGGADAKDQEGPGHYFARDPAISRGYAMKAGPAGRVLRCTIPDRGYIDEKTVIPARVIRQAIAAAPDLETTLSNWSENPAEARQLVFDAVTKYADGTRKDGAETALSLWAELYRRHAREYIRFMAKNGYNGLLRPDLVVVYNTSAIRIDEAIEVAAEPPTKEADQARAREACSSVWSPEIAAGNR